MSARPFRYYYNSLNRLWYREGPRGPLEFFRHGTKWRNSNTPSMTAVQAKGLTKYFTRATLLYVRLKRPVLLA